MHIADEANLPGLLYRHLLGDENSRACDAYYGLGDAVPKSLAIYAKWPGDKAAQLIPGSRVLVCDLTCEKGDLASDRLVAVSQSLRSTEVAVDPERGILLFGCKFPPDEVRVSYHHTAATELGGGEYERPIIDPSDDSPSFRTVRVRANGCCQGSGTPNLFKAIQTMLGQTVDRRCQHRPADASKYLKRQPESNDGPVCTEPHVATWHVGDDLCVEITESDTFCVPADERLQIAQDKTLIIRAAQGAWPMLHIEPVGANSCPLPWRILMEPGSKLVVDGLLIGGVTVEIVSVPATDGVDKKPKVSPATCRPCDGATSDGTSPKSPAGVEIHLRHTTLIPGGGLHSCKTSQHPSLSLSVTQAKLVIRHSVVGTLNVEHPECPRGCDPHAKTATCPLDPLAIEITDSIVDAAHRLPAIYSNCCTPAHADLTIERSTILGAICVQQMTRAENSLFAGIVHVQRRGIGYMRFCYVPADPETAALVRALFGLNQLFRPTSGSPPFEHAEADYCFTIRTPPQFKCVPEPRPSGEKPACSTGCGNGPTPPALAETTPPQPKFVSTEYGQPGFGELSLDCDLRILPRSRGRIGSRCLP